MKINTVPKLKTHEGAKAERLTPAAQLERTVMCCLLWENNFYEDGQSVADRIKELVPRVSTSDLVRIVQEAKTENKLRHVPLLIIREMARHKEHKGQVAALLHFCIQRADDLTEFLALYWKDKKEPLSAQVKKGLSKAFRKFDEYKLAKYNRDGKVKLRDVMFLTHPKPLDGEQEALFKRVAEDKLKTPDTWEVALSAGKDKKETWQTLLSEKKLGALALLRNLRNMEEANISSSEIGKALLSADYRKIIPFQFLTAGTHAPNFKPYLEIAFFDAVKEIKPLSGTTIVLIDVSGSMDANLSAKSKVSRMDVASSLGVLVNELSEKPLVFTFSNHVVQIQKARGFSLKEGIIKSQAHSGTLLGGAIQAINDHVPEYSRIIVVTDEQSQDTVHKPRGNGYIINVGTDQNGVAYSGDWTKINGWSESVIRFIQALEKEKNERTICNS